MHLKQKIVILGAGGLIGYKIFQKLKKTTRFQVKGVSHQKNIHHDIFKWDYKKLNKRIFKTLINAEIIINCIGENINEDLMDYKNILIFKLLTKILNKSKKLRLFIHISSCAVYGGSKKIRITESTEPKPSNLYSTTKLNGELFLKKTLNKKINLIILRSSQVIGEGFTNYSLKQINYFIKKKIFFFIQNERAKFSYIFFNDFFLVIKKLLEKKKSTCSFKLFNLSNYISFKELVKVNTKYLKINNDFFSLNYKFVKLMFLIITLLLKFESYFFKKKRSLNLNTLNSLTSKKIYISKSILRYLKISEFQKLNEKNIDSLIK